MEFNRISRVVGDRWVTLIALGLLGLISAVVFTSVANGNRTALFEATAAIRFEPIEGEIIADLADDIEQAQDFAGIAAGDLLQNDPTAIIVEDLAAARLLFIAQGRSEAEAGEKAQALIQSFLQTDPTIGGSVDDVLAQREAEALTIQNQIDELQATYTPAELATIEQIAFLDAKIDSIRARLVAITVAEAGAVLEAIDALQAEQVALETALTGLEQERGALKVPLIPSMSVEDVLLLGALGQRMDLLQAEYERLFLRKLGVTGAGNVEPTTFVDLGSEPADPTINGAVGLVAGLAVGMAGVLLMARTRKTLWLPEDVVTPVIGELPWRPVNSNAAEAWYDSAETGKRKSAVQALRVAVEAQLPAEGAAIAITGFGTDSQSVQALAADLATSVANAGTSVLLVDANYDSRSPLGEYRVAGASLAGVLGLDPDLPEFSAKVEHAVKAAQLIRPNLAVIPSGPVPSSPADLLAGRAFRRLIATAQEQYDLVVLVVDEFGTPAAQAAMQRVGRGLLVLQAGKSSAPEVNSMLADAERLRISMLGAVFVGKPDGLAAVLKSKANFETKEVVGGPRHPDPPPTHSPISRLQSYPIPERGRSAAVVREPLSELADQLDTGGLGGPNLGTDILTALRQLSPQKASDAVVEYLMTRTEDMVTARHGFGDLSTELIEAVEEFGFISLYPLKGHRTMSSWILSDIEIEVGVETAAEILDELERILTLSRNEPIDIDSWLSGEFMHRHVLRSDGQLSIVQLQSAACTVSILTPLRRLNVKGVELLIRQVAGTQIDEMIRFRKAAMARDDSEQVAAFDLQIDDVRTFRSSLERLLSSSDSILAWMHVSGLTRSTRLG